MNAVRATLTAALCLENFASQVVERHNKPEIEARASKEVILTPLVVSRNENEKVLIETSINSVRVSIKIKQADENDCQIKATFTNNKGNQVKDLISTFRDSDLGELLLKLKKELLKFGSHYDLFHDGRWKLLGQIGGQAMKGRIASYWSNIIEGTTNQGKGDSAMQQAKFKKLIKKVNAKFFGKDIADDRKQQCYVENSDAMTKTMRNSQNNSLKSMRT